MAILDQPIRILARPILGKSKQRIFFPSHFPGLTVPAEVNNAVAKQQGKGTEMRRSSKRVAVRRFAQFALTLTSAFSAMARG
jgi:hypothetical protein